MTISSKKIQSITKEAVPDFSPSEAPVELEGGNLNYVWRLQGEKRSLIVKVAPPYIAANPEVPLNPERIRFESDALRLFQDGNALGQLRTDKIRPPNFIYYDNQKHLLIMEDVGDWPTIRQAIKEESANPGIAARLGTFIGHLHQETYQSKKLADQFYNIDIQRTRFDVQYKAASDYALKSGITDTKELRAETVSLGKKLLDPGRCLVMGDLWPPSILVAEGNLRLIDWEFVHFGRPLQDIGHFAAHCWMQAHTASPQKKESFKKLWNSFWEAYRQASEAVFHKLFDASEYEDAATHIGAEILVRATGPFKEGYVYQSIENKHPQIREAVDKARQLIFADDLSTLWE